MNAVITILKLLPAIIEAIKAIEAAIPGQGNGEKKLATLREILEAVDGGVAAMWPQISATIGVLVKVFNTTGTFAK